MAIIIVVFLSLKLFFSIILYFCSFRYVAPEYASTGMLNERSDVYSFGILLMEIITGRNPVDYSRPEGEVCAPVISIKILGSLFFCYL